jgi:hypothetical protein
MDGVQLMVLRTNGRRHFFSGLAINVNRAASNKV